jgi:hypothetical protein
LVIQGVESDLFNNNGRPFSAEMRWNQFYCSNYNYYDYNLSSHSSLFLGIL